MESPHDERIVACRGTGVGQGADAGWCGLGSRAQPAGVQVVRRLGVLADFAEGREVSQPGHETVHHPPDCMRGLSHVDIWLLAGVGRNTAYRSAF